MPNLEERTEMSGEDKKSLEDKIDFLIEESNRDRKERKRERILSKLDMFYTILIPISFFIIGLLISQFEFLYYGSGFLVVLTALVLTMLYSFVIGFRAMIKDSIEDRILSWCLLVANVFLWSVFYLPLPLLYFIGQQYMLKEEAIYVWAFYGIAGLSGLVIFISQRILAQKFTNWAESKLSFHIGEKIIVWEKIKSKIYKRIVLIYAITLGVLIILLVLTVYF